MLKYQIGSFLALQCNVNYHGTGTMSATIQGKSRKIYDYFRADKVSVEQREKIKQAIKDVRFFTSGSRFAPELKTTLIAIPKKAYYENKSLIDSFYK